MVELMENNEDAIIELQTKVAFQEDLLENLNQVIIDQQAQITKLERSFEAMIEQVNSLQAAHSSGKQEVPPHY